MSINSVALSGRLTTDIEIRKTQEGKSVCAFTLARSGFHPCSDELIHPEPGSPEPAPAHAPALRECTEGG